MLTVPRQTQNAALPGRVISRTDSDRHSAVVIAVDEARMAAVHQPGWNAEPAGFEQLVLAYLRRPPLGMTPAQAVAS
jgi:hypothetical protein